MSSSSDIPTPNIPSETREWEDWEGEVKVSSSGRPLIGKDEIECILQNTIAIYLGDKVSKHEGGTLTLTTHRLLYNDSKVGCMCIHLSRIASISKKPGFLSFSSPKITIHLKKSSNYYKLSFRDGGMEPFYKELEKQLKKKNWEYTAQKQQKPKHEKREFSATHTGIGGIMRRVNEEDNQQQKALAEAFQDMSSLMDNARELVSMAEKFAEKEKSRNKSGETSKEEKKDEEDFDDLVMNMGIVSPVTKATAGSKSNFYQELARQIADFIAEPLKRSGGMMLLTDVYCLYNRVRGTDLISPDDLNKACELLNQLDLHMSLRQFDSGVSVLQSNDRSDKKIAENIVEMLEGYESFITPVDLAQKYDISIVLAKEQLMTAERNMHLCRDETVEGIAFHRNFFIGK
eukprot:gb/GECH01005826.1/.p1 GENE.gb/GECH01005826.1/~~gb/GECH01005826.1/.p1  ORF type:complete len:402 (+),score=111.59 gb/GECH01005826.1/:1-1206(+)